MSEYTWGLDLSGTIHGAGGIGGLLACEEPQAEGDPKRYWFFYDANGNVGQVLDATNTSSITIAAKYEYDPYGNLKSSSGPYYWVNPFRFSTKWYDAETGLYYYGHRYYSPRLGRWISRDPIGERGGLNLCAMVANSATNQIDPLGLTTPEQCAAMYLSGEFGTGPEALERYQTCLMLAGPYPPSPPPDPIDQPPPLSVSFDPGAVMGSLARRAAGGALGELNVSTPELPIGVYGPLQFVAAISGRIRVMPCCRCGALATQVEGRIMVSVTAKLLGSGHLAPTSPYGRLPTGEKVGRNTWVTDAAGNSVKCKDLKNYHNDDWRARARALTTFDGIKPCKQGISGSLALEASVTASAGFGFEGKAKCEWKFPGGPECKAEWYAGWTGGVGVDPQVRGYGQITGKLVID